MLKSILYILLRKLVEIVDKKRMIMNLTKRCDTTRQDYCQSTHGTMISSFIGQFLIIVGEINVQLDELQSCNKIMVCQIGWTIEVAQ